MSQTLRELLSGLSDEEVDSQVIWLGIRKSYVTWSVAAPTNEVPSRLFVDERQRQALTEQYFTRLSEDDEEEEARDSRGQVAASPAQLLLLYYSPSHCNLVPIEHICPEPTLLYADVHELVAALLLDYVVCCSLKLVVVLDRDHVEEHQSGRLDLTLSQRLIAIGIEFNIGERVGSPRTSRRDC